VELREPVVMMRREKFKQSKLQDESTEAWHWGGAASSSEEVAVMAMEQRGCVK